MCRRIFFCVFAIFASRILLAQYPSLNSHTISNLSSITFTCKGAYDGTNRTEVPPWIVAGGWRTYFFVDGIGTNLWSSPASMADNDEINLNVASRSYEASTSYIDTYNTDPGRPVDNWKRNYHGIYSAASFTHPVAGPVSLGFLHGENKNVVSGNSHYQNTIQPNLPINGADPDSYSGGSPYHEGWEAYNGIISAAWIPNTLWTNWGQQFFKNELGPIAWPATGYITKNGIKCTTGLRHPSSLIADDYIYVFYLESGAYGSNIPDEEGRHAGIKVVRAPLKDALDPHSYQAYYRSSDSDSTGTWNTSLPEGFTKENMLSYVAVKGPKATDIMGNRLGTSQEIRFSAAKVRYTDYFMGVEQYIDLADHQKYKVALRFSQDLVNWTDRMSIVYTADSWDQSQMNYPIFLDKDGWTNTEVDIDDFYILGTGSTVSNRVNRMHVQASQVRALATLYSNRTQEGPAGDRLFPNPCMGLFKLIYTVNSLSGVTITIFDPGGRKLMSRDEGSQSPGTYTEDLDISKWANGIYLVKIITGNNSSIYKVIKSQ
jgi:hypothetical protein